MKDNSVYEGNFDNNTLLEGTFTHFSGLKFKGKFARDKFKRGTIEFIDGDSMSGTWGNQRGKWVLKKG